MELKKSRKDKEVLENEGKPAGKGRGKGRGRRGRGRGRGKPDSEQTPEATARTRKAKGKAQVEEMSETEKIYGYTVDEWVAWGLQPSWEGWGGNGESDWDQQQASAASHLSPPQSAKSRRTQKGKLKEAEKETTNERAPKRSRKSKEAMPDEVEDAGQEQSRGKKQNKKDRGSEPTHERKRQKQKATESLSGTTAHIDQVEQSTVLPATKDLRVREMLKYLKGLKGHEEEEVHQLMRMRLQPFDACRVNIYWSRAAVGLKCRAEKKDFAYFRAKNCTRPTVFLLAAALKAAEMLATCMRFLMQTLKCI